MSSLQYRGAKYPVNSTSKATVEHSSTAEPVGRTLSAPQRRSYRYYDLLLGAFVTVLLCSNLIGPGKTCQLKLPLLRTAVVFGTGNIFFPISYIFGDVLTEVYGYARARRAIWVGFAGLVFAALMSLVIVRMPPASAEPFNIRLQSALELVFGNTWRVVVASIGAFWAGDFVNSYVLAKLKVYSRGRFLWTRTIGSTVAGQLVDSAIFYPVAFSWIWTGSTIMRVLVSNYLFKVCVEVILTPLTYLVVGWLKRAEQEDYFDVGTDFTPFSLDN